jgi:hypothetical protein
MVRGLRSQLSPKEESTLRLLAIAGHAQETLRPADLAHLRAVGLVELRDGVWLLTDLGTQRLSAAA